MVPVMCSNNDDRPFSNAVFALSHVQHIGSCRTYCKHLSTAASSYSHSRSVQYLNMCGGHLGIPKAVSGGWRWAGWTDILQAARYGAS